MNKTALLFGVGASLILAAGTANAAGTCGAEVAELQQKLGAEEGANATIGATDPGVQQPDPSASVDTSTSTTTSPSGSDQVADADNEANATIGATDPGVQQPDPGASADTSTTTTTDGSTTTAYTSTTTTTDGTSTTDTDTTGANATIGATDPGVQQPQDTDPVASSDSSTTTTTDSSSTTADSSTTTMPSGDVTETSRVGDMNTAAGGRAEAITALKKAQMHADAGDENACMTELSTAKTALGIE
jgi:hypothetical protein